jgi:glutamyl-tRNA synthetase
MEIGRLAPSPTGAQHIGNARTYLLAWLWVRSQGGRIVLRMEDVDGPRIKLGADAQALVDLQWLGLDWDEGPDVGGPHAPYVQTQRLDSYRTLLEQLKAEERVYPCTCTRKDVEEAASAPHAEGVEPVYPETCAHRSVADAASLDRPYCWRFRSANEVVQFIDAVKGPQSATKNDFGGDFVVWKNDGGPSYQLACVADDHAMDVTQVLRGDDLVTSTFRQLQLYRTFGWTPPRFAHVPLVVGPDGRRLAKRHGDTRLETVRSRGISSEKLLGLLAWSAGVVESPAPTTPRALFERFNLTAIPREPFVLTWKELQDEKSEP